MKISSVRAVCCSLILAFAAVRVQAGFPLTLKLPPSQTNIIAQGMGNAVAADGTLFNATSFNPALLGQAPHSVEGFVLGLNLSNDIIGLVDYAQNGLNFDPKQDSQDILNGWYTGNSTQVNQGLGDVQDMLSHLTNKALQAGAGVNIAVKIDKNWGFQVYNSTHAFSQVWRGDLSDSLLAIPLNGSSATAVSQSVTIMQNSMQSSIDQYLSSSQQSTLSGDITNLKNGTESIDQFKSNVNSTFPTVDTDSLARSILNGLTDKIGALTALLYSDTVAMLTYSMDPLSEVKGLTVGANLKVVNRHMAYDQLNLFSNSGLADSFKDNIKQSTTRWGFDLGCLYQLPELPVDFSLSAQDLFHQGANINPDSSTLMSNFISDPAPTVVRAGVSWHPVKDLRVNGDLDDIFSSTSLYEGKNGASRIKLGASYTALGFFNARVGFGNQNFSAGLGLLAGFFGLDYSYGADDLSQSYNHYAQMRFVF